MAYQKALEESEVQRINLKSIQTWIEANKANIKAKPNKTIIYAGLKLKVVEELSPADRKVLDASPKKMWEHIKDTAKKTHDTKFPGDFQMLSDVLTAIRTHPQFINRDRVQLKRLYSRLSLRRLVNRRAWTWKPFSANPGCCVL